MKINQLIDQDFISWYGAGLPPSLKAGSLQRELRLRDFARVELEYFGDVLTKSLLTSHNPNLAYHGLSHAERVMYHGHEALDCLQHLTNWSLPKSMYQAFLLALSQHDRGHPGATFFADLPPQRRLDPIWNDTAVEWQSAQLFDTFAVAHGLTIPQRLIGTYVIWSSTYGAATSHGKRLQLKRIQPKGLLGCLMRAADVAGSDNPVGNLHDHVAVNYVEIPADKPAQSLEGAIQQRAGFLSYVKTCYDNLDNAARCTLTTTLGWRKDLVRQLEIIEELKQINSPARAIFRAELLGAHIWLTE